MSYSSDCSYNLANQDFECLLRQQIGKNLTVKDFKIQALTQAGENYGSTMLAAELSILQDNEENTLPVVVKLLPPPGFLREAFDVEITFNKEVNAYKLVIPEYQSLQKEKRVPENRHINIFPKFYGARTNKLGDSTKKADESAIILLENLKILGYVTGDRILGLDFNHMKLGISQLAHFHALSVALKILKPDVFKETVLKACGKCMVGGISNEDVANAWIKSTADEVKCIPDCTPYIERIEMILREDMKEKRNPSSLPPKQPFAAFIHNDFWVNNMMFKYENNGSDDNQNSKTKIPIGMKFVDFQLTLYASPISDLIFYIYSSSSEVVVTNHFDQLINLYHCEFINCLRDLECDVNPFSRDSFEDELNAFAPKELPHILYMVKFIAADKSKVPDLSNCDADVMLKNNYAGALFEERVKFVVLDFVKRGWL